VRCGSRPRSRRCAATSTRARGGHRGAVPAAARGRHPHGPGPRARARAADHGSDQPARPRGVRGAPGAPQFLEGQLDDVRQTRRELSKVIRAIDAEIVSVFAAAFADVSQNFRPVRDALPRRPGRLKLTDPTTCSPPASRSRPGRRARTCASSRCSPAASARSPRWPTCSPCSGPASPFYVMDEVEAALDDVNLHRFLDLVAGVPRRGPAHHRQPPEAHHGGRRLPLRRHHAARRPRPAPPPRSGRAHRAG
jgi:hypothetical protein